VVGLSIWIDQSRDGTNQKLWVLGSAEVRAEIVEVGLSNWIYQSRDGTEVVEVGLSNRVDQSRDGTEVENQKLWVVGRA
jgi:hypothetical protein